MPADLVIAADIAVRLIDLRQALGLSQADFGALFGRGWKQVSAWENARQVPPPSVLTRAAARNEWPLEIFTEGGRMPSELIAAGPPERGIGPEEMSEAEESFRALVRNVKRTVRAMAGTPDLFSAEETRLNRLAVIRALVQSAEEAGRPIPSWVSTVEDEVARGTFR